MRIVSSRSPSIAARSAERCESSAGPGSTIATLPSPTIYVQVPLKVKGEAFGATRRRTIGESLVTGRGGGSRAPAKGSDSFSSLAIALFALPPALRRSPPCQDSGAEAMWRRAASRQSLQDIPMTLHTARAGIPSSAERIVRGFAIALGGSLLLAVSAKVQVPFYPVPMTLQTLVVLLLGAGLGAKLAAASVGLYLIEGLASLPVFAGAVAGPPYMAGPTGGFLLGFLAAAALIGFAADRFLDRSWIRLLVSLSIGHAVIFAFGFVWLAQLIGGEKAFAAGVAPFALATILKTLLAVALVGAWRRAFRRIGRT